LNRRANDSTEALDVVRGGIGKVVPTLFWFEVPVRFAIGSKVIEEAAGPPIHGRSAHDRPGAMDGVPQATESGAHHVAARSMQLRLEPSNG
jgi:hypothetical protein